jgi:hypothetical protein
MDDVLMQALGLGAKIQRRRLSLPPVEEEEEPTPIEEEVDEEEMLPFVERPARRRRDG